jgi:Zinc-ribbon like family
VEETAEEREMALAGAQDWADPSAAPSAFRDSAADLASGVRGGRPAAMAAATARMLRLQRRDEEGGGVLDDAETCSTVAQQVLANRTLSMHPELMLHCTYCNEPLALPAMMRWATQRGDELRQRPTRLWSCLRCNKPLPRCSLCLLSMAVVNPLLKLRDDLASSRTPRGGESASTLLASQKDAQPLSEWWTWCQGCRHGGHAEHLAEWFSRHAICPVARCRCRCQLLDPRLGTKPRVLSDLDVPSPGQPIWVPHREPHVTVAFPL